LLALGDYLFSCHVIASKCIFYDNSFVDGEAGNEEHLMDIDINNIYTGIKFKYLGQIEKGECSICLTEDEKTIDTKEYGSGSYINDTFFCDVNDGSKYKLRVSEEKKNSYPKLIEIEIRVYYYAHGYSILWDGLSVFFDFLGITDYKSR
jgi:hypothetical protein